MVATVGVMIGLGIFRTPGEVAGALPDPVLYIALWLGGGLFVILSTAIVGELMAVTNRSGGSYALIHRSLGPYPAFIVGWVDWASFGATIALKAVVFAEFLTLLWPAAEFAQLGVSLFLVVFFGLLQLLGIQAGARIQLIASFGLMGILVVSCIALIWIGPQSLCADLDPVVISAPLSALGLAAAAVVFTFDGWMSGSLFGGEVRGGGQSVARESLRAVVLTVVLYLGVNLALLFVLPISDIAGSELPIKVALDQGLGPWGGNAVIVALLLVLLAGINIMFLGGPRILQALSSDGMGIDAAEAVGPRGNPLVAVLMTAALALVMVLFGGFNALLNMSALLVIIIYATLMIAVAVLRKREPDLPRQVSAWGYPLSLIVAVMGWISIGVFIAIAAPETAWVTLALVCGSIPSYYLIKLRARRA